MISESLQNIINKQINAELYSEYLYLSIAIFFKSIGLNGFENFFLVQVQEEQSHAMKIINYLIRRGGDVKLNSIELFNIEFNEPKTIFEIAYKHEIKISEMINNIMTLAIKEYDHATRAEFEWFVTEQVEEEKMFISIINKLRILNRDGYGILMIDDELSKKQFIPIK